jgi:hypothetical protein
LTLVDIAIAIVLLITRHHPDIPRIFILLAINLFLPYPMTAHTWFLLVLLVHVLLSFLTSSFSL